jgi:predicted nucleotide-binding protein
MSALPCLKHLVWWLARRKGCVSRQELRRFLKGEEHVDEMLDWLLRRGVIGNGPSDGGKLQGFEVLPSIQTLARKANYCKGYGEVSGQRHRVFIVHGRDKAALTAMATFLESLGYEPISFDQAISFTGKPAPTTSEVLNAGMKRAYAVLVLLTGDELARLKSDQKYHRDDDGPDETTLQSQPRLNVVFEAGMAWARFPNRTILVQQGDRLRPISDLAGVNFIKFTGSEKERESLAGRLRRAGCKPLKPKSIQKVKKAR